MTKDRVAPGGNPAPRRAVSPVVRAWVVAMLLLHSASAVADDALGIREGTPEEPLLHLDAFLLDRVAAEGGVAEGHATALALGPRARLAVEGRWWQTGLAPSLFAEDLQLNGWRASGELSYDLGPFRVGVNASLTRHGDASHRMVGLFAYRTFRLSRWMHAWIMLGVAHEQWGDARTHTNTRGVYLGLSLGTTFR